VFWKWREAVLVERHCVAVQALAVGLWWLKNLFITRDFDETTALAEGSRSNEVMHGFYQIRKYSVTLHGLITIAAQIRKRSITSF